MPQQKDFALASFSDGILTLSLTPPTAIGNWLIHYQQTLRFGGDTLVNKWVGSGLNGASGITITNSGNGVMQIALHPDEVSGTNPGAYAYRVTRENSGFMNILAEGYRLQT